MVKTIACLIAVICVVAIKGDGCFDEKEMEEEIARCYEVCKDEGGGDKLEVHVCMVKNLGFLKEDKIDYDALVAKVNSSFTSEDKKKIVLDGLEDCKGKHPDFHIKNFWNCYAGIIFEQCSGK